MQTPPVFAIDIGGTKTRIAVFESDEPHELGVEPTDDDFAATLNWIGDTIDMFDPERRIHDVGVGCPGPLDPKTGDMLNPPSLPGWHGLDLLDRLKGMTRRRVALDNDANLGALGEATHGSGKGADPLFYMTISTGIGTGIVADGRILGGAHGLAGEIWTFDPFDYCGASVPKERCPKRLKANINNMASGTGMVACARDLIADGMETSLDPDSLTTHAILEAGQRRDRVAREVMDNARATIAASLAFAIHFLDPKAIVLGGGLCTDETWFVRPVRRRVKQLLGPNETRRIPIRRAKLWDRAVLYGARALALERRKQWIGT